MNQERWRNGVPNIVARITTYLGANPGAADTLEGVRGVWLDGQAAAGLVQEALELMVLEGLLSSRTLPDGSVLFADGARPKG